MVIHNHSHICRHDEKNKQLGAGIARTIAPNSSNDISIWKDIDHESHG